MQETRNKEEECEPGTQNARIPRAYTALPCTLAAQISSLRSDLHSLFDFPCSLFLDVPGGSVDPVDVDLDLDVDGVGNVDLDEEDPTSRPSPFTSPSPSKSTTTSTAWHFCPAHPVS